MTRDNIMTKITIILVNPKIVLVCIEYQENLNRNRLLLFTYTIGSISVFVVLS